MKKELYLVVKEKIYHYLFLTTEQLVRLKSRNILCYRDYEVEDSMIFI